MVRQQYSRSILRLNNTAVKSEPDYGILHQAYNAIVRRLKQYLIAKEKRKIHALITQAEAMRELTGHRYMVIRFKGELRVVAKATIRLWLLKKIFKPGTTMEQLEKAAIYITKLKPVQPTAKSEE